MYDTFRPSQVIYSLVHIQILTTLQKSEAGLNWNVVRSILQTWRLLVYSLLLLWS